jgi:hypothetical protein
MGVRLVLLAMLAGSAFAQSPDVTLRIETASGGTQFRIGETISLKLTFENSSAEEWEVPGVVVGGRSVLGLWRDRFLVSPKEGTDDPWSFGLREGSGGSIGGGPGIGAKPVSINVDLNQWVRFDRAGRYRVSALFHATARQQPDVAVNSNEIDIEIVPAGEEWLEQQLRQAVAVLDAPAGNDPQSFNARGAAVRAIWYLDTPESVSEAARLLGALDDQTGRPLQLALRGSRHQDAAIAAMNELLRSPDEPVRPRFIQTLALLESLKQFPMPADPGAADPDGRRRADAAGAKGQQLQTELASVVERKRGEAKAISFDTPLSGTRFDAITANMRAEVANVFMDLPWREQSDLLGGQWKKIAGPAMIPVLRELYENPPKAPPQQSLVPAAVERLYELDRERTHTLILDDIKRDTPRLPYATLALLEDATLPDIDQVLLDKEEHNRAEADDLLARYATGDILDGVKAAGTKGRGSLACRAGLIAYYLRVDPAWGQRVLRQVLSEREDAPGGCWLQILGKTAQYYAGPEWEKVATEALADPVVVLKWDAVRALGEHGSAAAQPVVMETFRAWHDWWKDRPAEMNKENRQFEQGLYRASAEAKNWVAGADQLEKIRDFCITAYCKGQVDQHLGEWKDTVTIWMGSSDAGNVGVSFAQYMGATLDAARARLLEVPAGSRLKWHFNVVDTPEIEAWIAGVDQDLAARGVVITR